MLKTTRRNGASVVALAALAFLCCYGIACGSDDEPPVTEPNVEATIAAAMAKIAATQEVAGPTATPTATATNTPRPSPTPTVAPAPTEGLTPVPTPPTDVAANVEPLAPLPMTDADAFLAGLSEAERSCLSKAVSPDQLIAVTNSPELATDGERQAFLGCLEEETTLRLFLTAILDAAGSLSLESSSCMRSAFADTDVGAMLLAASADPGTDPNAEAAMAQAMVSFIVSLSCLNETEFAAAGSAMDISPSEYENFQCVMEAMGGPDEMAAQMRPDAGFPGPLFAAASSCQLEMGGPPPGS